MTVAGRDSFPGSDPPTWTLGREPRIIRIIRMCGDLLKHRTWENYIVHTNF